MFAFVGGLLLMLLAHLVMRALKKMWRQVFRGLKRKHNPLGY